MDFEEKTLKRESKFKGHIFEVAVDEVLLPDGKTEGKIIIVKQYRKAIEAVSYEIPAGKLEVGEAGDEMAAAARELEEETQYKGDLELIYEFYTAIGFCNERIKLYVATNLKPVENPRPLDDDEFLELYELTYEECMELVASGAIQDAKTIIALQYYALHFGGK